MLQQRRTPEIGEVALVSEDVHPVRDVEERGRDIDPQTRDRLGEAQTAYAATTNSNAYSAGRRRRARRVQNWRRPIAAVSAVFFEQQPVMRKPETTKKTSTPRKPPGSQLTSPWNTMTAATATARSPSSDGEYRISIERGPAEVTRPDDVEATRNGNTVPGTPPALGVSTGRSRRRLRSRRPQIRLEGEQSACLDTTASYGVSTSRRRPTRAVRSAFRVASVASASARALVAMPRTRASMSSTVVPWLANRPGVPRPDWSVSARCC